MASGDSPRGDQFLKNDIVALQNAFSAMSLSPIKNVYLKGNTEIDFNIITFNQSYCVSKSAICKTIETIIREKYKIEEFPIEICNLISDMRGVYEMDYFVENILPFCEEYYLKSKNRFFDNCLFSLLLEMMYIDIEALCKTPQWIKKQVNIQFSQQFKHMFKYDYTYTLDGNNNDNNEMNNNNNNNNNNDTNNTESANNNNDNSNNNNENNLNFDENNDNNNNGSRMETTEKMKEEIIETWLSYRESIIKRFDQKKMEKEKESFKNDKDLNQFIKLLNEKLEEIKIVKYCGVFEMQFYHLTFIVGCHKISRKLVAIATQFSVRSDNGSSYSY